MQPRQASMYAQPLTHTTPDTLPAPGGFGYRQLSTNVYGNANVGGGNTLNIVPSLGNSSQPRQPSTTSPPPTGSSSPVDTRAPAPAPKMMIMHKPQIMAPMYVGPLPTINQQRSSAYQSEMQSYSIIGRSTHQGYNVSEMQKKQFEQDKKIVEEGGCCFCWGAKPK